MSGAGPRLAAVVLAGGRGTRLGGVDKGSLGVAGSTLLERALAATAMADQVVVVGTPRSTSRPVTWAREEPPDGGPAAGLLAGLDVLTPAPELVCVLAVDMPGFTAATLGRLVTVVRGEGADAACLVDEGGRTQWLAGVYRYAGLQAARPADRSAEHGLATRRLVSPLCIRLVPARADEAHDVDTWEDLHRLGG